MERRPLGATGLDVTVIGMGTWQTYDVRRASAVQAVTDAALGGGAAFFDSSPMYGAAERVLAETLGERRKQVVIATKVRAGSAREGREQIHRALDRYGGVVDVYQIHNLEAWRTHLPYLEELKAAGRIRAVGITHYATWITSTGPVATISAMRPNCEAPYNPREREVERELLPLAAERRLGVIPMRPPGQGGPVRAAPPARELGFLARHGLVTWAQALLNWGISDPRVTVTIPATRDARHAADNCAVGGARRFDGAARERVAALAARL